MDQKNIDRLYKMLTDAEKRRDKNATAALKWAIFSLEEFTRKKYTGEEGK